MSSNWAAMQARLSGNKPKAHGRGKPKPRAGAPGVGGSAPRRKSSHGALASKRGGSEPAAGRPASSSHMASAGAALQQSRPPAPYAEGAEAGSMLEPGELHFEACLRACYRGFVHERSGISPALTQRVLGTLEALRRQGRFHHDTVLAPHRGVQTPTPTTVKRILVGDDGITYKYLGLRTFAYPWSAAPFAVLRELNAAMSAQTARLLGRNLGAEAVRRSAHSFNLTLINLLEAGEPRGGALRNKAGARLGGFGAEQAVAWHADSSLVDWSSIAVLNVSLNEGSLNEGGVPWKQKERKGEKKVKGTTPWRIAMKCVGAGHEPAAGAAGTPALAVPLGDGDCYYMLDDFNHHHHHAVLAGSCGRYSSTHRVAVTATDTFAYIWARAEAALAVLPPRLTGPSPSSGARSFSGPSFSGPLRAADVRLCEEVHSEVELEWLRHWGAQGTALAASHHDYWRPRIARLQTAWERLEARTAAFVALLCAAADAAPEAAAALLPEGARCFDVLEQQLIKREGRAATNEQLGRAGWRARLQAKAYRGVEAEHRPFDALAFSPDRALADVEPALSAESLGLELTMMGEDCAPAIAQLRRAKARFAQRRSKGRDAGPVERSAAAPANGGVASELAGSAVTKKRKRPGGKKGGGGGAARAGEPPIGSVVQGASELLSKLQPGQPRDYPGKKQLEGQQQRGPGGAKKKFKSQQGHKMS